LLKYLSIKNNALFPRFLILFLFLFILLLLLQQFIDRKTILDIENQAVIFCDFENIFVEDSKAYTIAIIEIVICAQVIPRFLFPGCLTQKTCPSSAAYERAFSAKTGSLELEIIT
jgi:hypothetical protein